MKLKLNLEQLTVDSFDTSATERPKGTVFGEQCTCYTNCTCPGCPTCDATCLATCAFTCDDASCAGSCGDSCYGTCGDFTCALTCEDTCRPRLCGTFGTYVGGQYYCQVQ